MNELPLGYTPVEFPSGYSFKKINIIGEEFTIVRSYFNTENTKQNVIELEVDKDSIFDSHKYVYRIEFDNFTPYVYWYVLVGDWTTFFKSTLSEELMNYITYQGYARIPQIDEVLSQSIYCAKMLIINEFDEYTRQHLWGFELYPQEYNQLPSSVNGLIVHNLLSAVTTLKLATEGYLAQACTLAIHDPKLKVGSGKPVFLDSTIQSWVLRFGLQDSCVVGDGMFYLHFHETIQPLMENHNLFKDIVEIIWDKLPKDKDNNPVPKTQVDPYMSFMETFDPHKKTPTELLV